MANLIDADFTAPPYVPVGFAPKDAKKLGGAAAAAAAPPPCAAPPTDPGKVSNTSYSLETDRAGQLGINYVGTGNLEIDKKMKVFIREYAKYDTCHSANGEGVLRYGAVWRATVLIDQTDATGKINFAMVAASATLKNLTVEVSITHEGFAAADRVAVDEASTAAMEATANGLNVASFVKFSEQVEKAVRAAMQAQVAQPLRYLGYEPVAPDDLSEAVARTFALSYIARGEPCTKAIAEIPTKGARTEAVIKETYKALTKTECDASNKIAQVAAEQLLGGIKVKLPWW
jgi:hypothetical protein